MDGCLRFHQQKAQKSPSQGTIIYRPPKRNAFGKVMDPPRPPQAETPIYDPRATFCRSCGRNFFEIAAECTQSWIAWTTHIGESQRDRDLRASSFLYGIETGVLLFSSPGLSQCPLSRFHFLPLKKDNPLTTRVKLTNLMSKL